MKKHIMLSVVAVGMLSSVNVQAADDALSTMFKNGKVSGQIREFTIGRTTNYANATTGKPDKTVENANVIGGHLKFETAAFNGFSMGTAFYTSNGFLLPETDPAGENDRTYPNKTVLGADGKGYSLLGEAYVQYKTDGTTFKFGRQKVNSPLIGADDARMIPTLFESAELTNTSIKGVKLNLAHTTGISRGSFANGYIGNLQGATAGYTANRGTEGQGDFQDIGTNTVGKTTKGITSVGVTYTGVEGLKAQLWDYYAHNVSNTIYGDISYKMKTGSVTPFVAAQFIKQSAVGDKLLKNADSGISTDGELEGFYYGLKAGVSVSSFTTYLAYSKTSENSDADLAAGNTAKNSIILMTGGYPVYTQGMVTRHQTLAGVSSTKLAASYSFKKMGPDVKVVGYYVKVDYANSNAGFNEDLDTDEKGFDIIYNTAWAKNLQLRLRGNMVKDWTSTGTQDVRDFKEYRFIANYSF